MGPQIFLLLPALLLPLGFAAFAGNRRAAFLIWSQIAVQLFVWVTVPYARSGHVFANVRYLIGALGLAFAVAAHLEVSGRVTLDGRELPVRGLLVHERR